MHPSRLLLLALGVGALLTTGASAQEPGRVPGGGLPGQRRLPGSFPEIMPPERPGGASAPSGPGATQAPGGHGAGVSGHEGTGEAPDGPDTPVEHRVEDSGHGPAAGERGHSPAAGEHGSAAGHGEARGGGYPVAETDPVTGQTMGLAIGTVFVLSLAGYGASVVLGRPRKRRRE